MSSNLQRVGLTITAMVTILLASGAVAEEPLSIRSPNGKIELSVRAAGPLRYAVMVDGKETIASSKLGLEFKGGAALGRDAEVVKADRVAEDSSWENPFGKRRRVRDHYNGLTLTLKEKSANGQPFQVAFRVYDDGAALRYVVPADRADNEQVITRELTEFAFPADAPCWAGSQLNGFSGPQEWEFWPTHLAALPGDRVTGLPLLVHTPSAWLAIAESDLRDYSGMWLTTSATPPPPPKPARHTEQTPAPTRSDLTKAAVTLYAHLAPRLDGNGLVRFDAGAEHRSPWRVILIAREPGKLIESDLVSNLAAPNELGDVSWIKPGMMAWDHWWSGDVKMDTATLKQYIQLAAEMGWPYQLIDWNWYGSFNKPDSDITHVNPAVDMNEVRRFAREKNVRLWVWLYWTDVDRNDAYKKAFALYEQWGIAGVKIDFMDRDDQEMVNWYEKITRAAAEHHLMINFHGAFKTSGFNRTFPNQVTREGILGNEYNRWSKRVTPEHELTLPFTRFLSGPADFTPGGFLNRQPAQFKADKNAAQVQGTRAAELALFVAYDSPVCCVCDHPDHYRGQGGADFLKIVPTVWDDTRVLDAVVSEHLAIARRAADGRWFLGALTDGNPRDMDLKLDFLSGGGWKMRLWKDAADSDVNAEHIETEERAVTPADLLKVHLAPAGGCVAIFEPR